MLCTPSRRSLLPLVAVITFVASQSARAAVLFNFSGGSGSPLTITLPQPITYQIVTNGSYTPMFVIDGVGDVFSHTISSTTGTLMSSFNGGSPTAFGNVGSGLQVFNITQDDIFFRSAASSSGSSGNIVTLSTGSLTSLNNVAGPVPAPGYYQSFLGNEIGQRISAFAVPEPASLSLLAFGSLALVRRRRML